MAPPPSGTRPTSQGALERAQTLLSTWLPGRAAERVLERALDGATLEPGEVDGEHVAAALLGPVYRELRHSVPRETLRRELKRLARSLRSEAHGAGRDHGGSKPNGAATQPAPVFEPDADPAEPARAALDDRSALDDRGALGSTAAMGAPNHASGPPRTSGEPADPDDAVMALAVLDGVDGVAIYDAVGRAVSVRGDMDDAEGLGRVLAASGHLLARHGMLRSFGIVAGGGTLVSVPVSDRWIAISGAPDMNLGAVYAALTALEEER